MMVDQSFYYSLGRLVICPRCGMHSDLSLDQAKLVDDEVSIEQMLKSRRGCQAFHEDPLLAWLWFKWHKSHPQVDTSGEAPPQREALTLENLPEAWETPTGPI